MMVETASEDGARSFKIQTYLNKMYPETEWFKKEQDTAASTFKGKL